MSTDDINELLSKLHLGIVNNLAESYILYSNFHKRIYRSIKKETHFSSDEDMMIMTETVSWDIGSLH